MDLVSKETSLDELSTLGDAALLLGLGCPGHDSSPPW
jgi:hypothetical protein